MRSMRALILSASMVFGLFMMASQAEATLRLELFNPATGHGAIVTDGGAFDINPTLGAVTFSGAIDGFTINVTTGISIPPAIGPCCSLDLNSVNVQSSGGGGSLVMLLESDGFPGPGGPQTLIMDIGGTINGGTASFASWVNPGNLVPTLGPDGTGTVPAPGAIPAGSVLACNPTFGGPAFSTSCQVGFTQAGPFSMFGQATLTFTGTGIVSFNESQRVAEPGTALLFGSGLVAIALWGRKLSKLRG